MGSKMPVSLDNLMIYIIREYTRRTYKGIGRTKLMKLLFLIDYHAFKEKGKKITGLKWIKWLYGPFSRKVLDTLDALEAEGKIYAEEIPGLGVFYISSYYNVNISENVRKMVDEVLKEYATKSLDYILTKVYNLPEVKNKDVGDYIL